MASAQANVAQFSTQPHTLSLSVHPFHSPDSPTVRRISITTISIAFHFHYAARASCLTVGIRGSRHDSVTETYNCLIMRECMEPAHSPVSYQPPYYDCKEEHVSTETEW